jgi:hypothetical protein
MEVREPACRLQVVRRHRLLISKLLVLAGLADDGAYPGGREEEGRHVRGHDGIEVGQ